MIAAADRTERLLMVSQNRRYYPGLIAFRDTVAQLGRLSNLTCQFFIAHRDGAAEFLFGFPEPLLLDMAIHLFDGARAITGADPVSVYCESSNPPWSWYAGRRRRGRDLHDDRRAPLHVHRQLGRGRVPHLVDRAPGARPASAAARSGRTRARRWSRRRGASASKPSRRPSSDRGPERFPGSSSRSPSSSTRSARAASPPASATTTSARSRCATPRSSPRARGGGSPSRRNLVA